MEPRFVFVRGRGLVLVTKALDVARGEAGMLAGLDHAELGAPQGWVEAAVAAIRWVALRYAFVTADDVWATGLGHPGEARALGPSFRRAQGMGVVEPTTQFVLTTQVLRHRAPIRVWRSKLYDDRNVFTEAALYSRQSG
jgi:hypothetical protein